MDYNDEDFEIFSNGGHIYLEHLSGKDNYILNLMSLMNQIVKGINDLAYMVSNLEQHGIGQEFRMIFISIQPQTNKTLQELAPWILHLIGVHASNEAKDFLMAFADSPYIELQSKKIENDPRFVKVDPLETLMNKFN